MKTGSESLNQCIGSTGFEPTTTQFLDKYLTIQLNILGIFTPVLMVNAVEIHGSSLKELDGIDSCYYSKGWIDSINPHGQFIDISQIGDYLMIRGRSLDRKAF